MKDFIWCSNSWIKKEIKDGNYFIIKDSKKIYGAICIATGKVASIETIAVKKSKQGSGIGRKLIEFAKKYTVKKGFNKLVVESFCDYNLENFYKECGFKKLRKLGYYKNKPYYRFYMVLKGNI